jgi:hypothetical protein
MSRIEQGLTRRMSHKKKLTKKGRRCNAVKPEEQEEKEGLWANSRPNEAILGGASGAFAMGCPLMREPVIQVERG